MDFILLSACVVSGPIPPEINSVVPGKFPTCPETYIILSTIVASENGNPSFSDSIDVKCAISTLSSFSFSVLLRNNSILHEENSNIMMNRFIFVIFNVLFICIINTKYYFI